MDINFFVMENQGVTFPHAVAASLIPSFCTAYAVKVRVGAFSLGVPSAFFTPSSIVLVTVSRTVTLLSLRTEMSVSAVSSCYFAVIDFSVPFSF